MFWLILFFTAIVAAILWRRRSAAASKGGSPKPLRGSQKTSCRWLSHAESAVVAGRDIGGMVYVGRGPTDVLGQISIDPSMEATERGGDWEGEGMHYWPSYALITSRTRATYLDWLAGGRSHVRYDVGYMFLYFYGLEYRFFCDQPGKEEQKRIIEEVERLLLIYGENHSVRSYLGTFLEVAEIFWPRKSALQPTFECAGHEMPIGLRMAIGCMLKAEQPIKAEWMLAWLTTHPDVSLRRPAERAFPEFKALFCIKFSEKYPTGLRIACPRRKLAPRYRAASGAFEVDLTEQVDGIPDIRGLTKPLKDMQQIADEAQDELGRFSRYLGRNPEGRNTIEGHALLPSVLWKNFKCPELERLKPWLTACVESSSLVPVADLLERLEGQRPERIRKAQLTGAADALARLSIGMAPDPRYAFRGPRCDEPVILFPLPEGVTSVTEASPGYLRVLLSVALGMFMAQADGTVSEEELRHIKDLIDANSSLSAAEQARLHANIKWMLAVPPDLGLIRRRVRDMDADARHEWGRLALAVAGADGKIEASEITALRKLYAALGLEAESVYSDLHELAARPVGGPVTVQQPTAEPVEYTIRPKPEESDAAEALTLDPARVAAIMEDTSRVSSLLHGIFTGEEEDQEPEDPEEPETDPKFLGLDAKHREMLQELFCQPAWATDDFERLARRFDVLPGGALETLNEWAYDQFDEPLIEEDEVLHMNPELARQLHSPAEASQP